MVCFHKNYKLGDDHKYDRNDYNSWEELLSAIERDNPSGLIYEPLYLYDHGGTTISTSPFSCKWDSGQVGYIYASKDSIRKEFGVKRLTKGVLERAYKVMEGEVRVYDQYLTGDVYGFIIKGEDGETEDSCWGFYGSDPCTNGMLDRLSGEDATAVKEQWNYHE
jgi:hypothetical protein